MTEPMNRHELAGGHYEIDFPGRLRLTHYPSGFTCLRHDWMTGRDTSKWLDKLRECVEAHPEARFVFNGRGDLVGDIRDMPAFGGGFLVGDMVVTRDPEEGRIARMVLATAHNGDPMDREADDAVESYLLEDGSSLYFSGREGGWMTTGTDGKHFARARRIVEAEDAEELRWPAGRMLAAALDRLGSDLDGNDHLQRVACSDDDGGDALRRERYAALKEAFSKVSAELREDPHQADAYASGIAALADAKAFIEGVQDLHGPATPEWQSYRDLIGAELPFVETVSEGIRQRGPLPESPRPGF